VCVYAPIDLVKVRLQGQTTVQRYRGPVHCIAVILRKEGPKGLFRGGLAIALRDIPFYGLYFLPYEVTRKALTQSGKEPGQCVSVRENLNQDTFFIAVRIMKYYDKCIRCYY